MPELLDLDAVDAVDAMKAADATLHARFEQACALQAQACLPEAQQAFEHLLHAAPAGHAVCAPSWANLGLVLDDQGQADAARRAYEQAIALDPSLYAPLLHLGQWWLQRPEPDAPAQAEHHLQQAARLQPDAPAAWSALGALLTCLRRDDDAQACLHHALQLDPSNDSSRFNLSYLRLRQGRWAEGWACLEARPSSKALAAQLPWPRWGGEALAGRRLLVVNDAGHGDFIHFWRWRHHLKALGAGEVIWMVQPALIPLLQAQAGVDAVWSLDDDPPLSGPQAPELWAPLMSLPWLCGDDGHWPAELPYLYAPPQAASPASPPAHEAPRPFTIGLVWHGNPRHENDAERSLPSVAALAPVVQAAHALGLRVLNLQAADAGRDGGDGVDDGARDDALPSLLPGLLPGPPLTDFAQAAQAMQHIDLLITVDTAYAHLAGALGRPVWVMLPHWKTDWRWLEGRSDSPWYPGVMRLFRQAHRGDWAGVIAEVAAALKPCQAG